MTIDRIVKRLKAAGYAVTRVIDTGKVVLKRHQTTIICNSYAEAYKTIFG